MTDEAQTAEPKPQNIHQAIHAVKTALALHGIAKDRKNAEQKYQFRGVEDVLNALSELFVEHRINVVPRIVHTQSIARTTSKGSAMPASFVDAEFDLVSVDDGSMVTFKACGEGSDMSDKGTNKAMSAAFKYAMTLGFVIPTVGVLDEGDATSPGNEEPSRQQQGAGGGRSNDDEAKKAEAWARREIETFNAYTAEDYAAYKAHVEDEVYLRRRENLKGLHSTAHRHLLTAERNAHDRTDDVPF